MCCPDTATPRIYNRNSPIYLPNQKRPPRFDRSEDSFIKKPQNYAFIFFTRFVPKGLMYPS